MTSTAVAVAGLREAFGDVVALAWSAGLLAVFAALAVRTCRQMNR